MFGHNQDNPAQPPIQQEATWATLMLYAQPLRALTPAVLISPLGLRLLLDSLVGLERFGFQATCAAAMSLDRYSIRIRDGPTWGSHWSMESRQEIRWAILHR